MILGPLTRHPPQPLSDATGTSSGRVFVERVHHFKLFGINISHDMNWQLHIDAITHKAASRLHFLSLKKSGLKSHLLLHFYLTVIRPVLEYCSVVWHHGLTESSVRNIGGHTTPGISHCLPTNHRHALYLCTQSCQLAFSSWPPWTNKQTIFQIYTFLLHFLLTSWCHFQIASCICLPSPGYTHKTLHILY